MRNLPRLLPAVMPYGAGLTLAQEFAAKAIRSVAPSTPGGSSDTLARVVALRSGELLGQRALFENRVGAIEARAATSGAGL